MPVAQKPSNDAPAITLGDRLCFALIGTMTGAIYGLVAAAVIAYVTDQFSLRIIGWIASVFGLLSFFFGNFALEAILILVHFFWGAANGVAENTNFNSSDSPGYLRTLSLLGFSLALALTGWQFWE